MAGEIAESGAAARALSRRERGGVRRARPAVCATRDPAVVVTNARGSSDHCALYLKYLVEIALGVPCASLGPSIASLYRAPLRLAGAVAISISQSGRSPDIVAAQAAARAGGAQTLALVNDVDSPLARAAEHVAPASGGRRALGGRDQIDDRRACRRRGAGGGLGERRRAQRRRSPLLPAQARARRGRRRPRWLTAIAQAEFGLRAGARLDLSPSPPRRR